MQAAPATSRVPAAGTHPSVTRSHRIHGVGVRLGAAGSQEQKAAVTLRLPGRAAGGTLTSLGASQLFAGCRGALQPPPFGCDGPSTLRLSCPTAVH